MLVNTAYTQLWPLPGTGQLRRVRERERETLLRVRAWECLEFGGQAEWVGPAQPRPEPETGGCSEAGAGLALATVAQAGPQSHHYSSTWDQLRAAQCWSMWPILPHTTETGDRGEHVTAGWAASHCVTGLRDTKWRRDSDWRVSGAMFFFIIYYTTRSMLLSLRTASEHRPGLIIYTANILISELEKVVCWKVDLKINCYFFLRNLIFHVSWGEWVIVLVFPFDSLDFTHSFDYGWELKWRFCDLLKHAGGENNRVTFVLLCCQLW